MGNGAKNNHVLVAEFIYCISCIKSSFHSAGFSPEKSLMRSFRVRRSSLPIRPGIIRPGKSGALEFPNQGRITAYIDIATTDNDTHAFAFQFLLLTAGGSETEAAGWFDHDFHAFGKKAHGVDQLVIAGS